MEFINAKDLAVCGAMSRDNGVIVLQDGKLKYMTLADLLNYIASASIESDKTLTLDGVAADAKVTGEEIGKRVNKSGDTMTGDLAMGGNKVTGLGAPTEETDAVTKEYADMALPKSGGSMTGVIAMGGNKVTGLGAPSDDGDAANKAYVDGKRLVFTTTISASGWSDWGNGYYAATVTANGLLPTDYPHITLTHSKDTIVTAKEEYSKIMMAWSDNNLIAFLCYEDIPTIDLNISVEVNR